MPFELPLKPQLHWWPHPSQNNPQETKEVTQLSLTLGAVIRFCVLIGLRACDTWCLPGLHGDCFHLKFVSASSFLSQCTIVGGTGRLVYCRFRGQVVVAKLSTSIGDEGYEEAPLIGILSKRRVTSVTLELWRASPELAETA
jgi:hypothetical protein